MLATAIANPFSVPATTDDMKFVLVFVAFVAWVVLGNHGGISFRRR